MQSNKNYFFKKKLTADKAVIRKIWYK